MSLNCRDSGSSDGDGDSDSDSDGDSDGDVERGECVEPPIASGVFQNNISDIDFNGEVVEAHIEHKLDIDPEEDGCIVVIELLVRKAGLGCEFSISFRSVDAEPLAIVGASLSADSFCPNWSDSDEGIYTYVGGDAQIRFVPRVPDRTVERSCIGNATASLNGTITLRSDERELSVELGSLSFTGDFLSIGNTELTCPCYPECGDRVCGREPQCGVSCGECTPPDECNEMGFCGDCIPNCEGRQCGANGCGGTCAPGCSGREYCNESSGICECDPDCSERECGTDGCGGNCGLCGSGHECNELGRCECIPDCDGRQCGDDGCGGTCGTCGSGRVCNESSGACECNEACFDFECGPDSCGGDCFLPCTSGGCSCTDYTEYGCWCDPHMTESRCEMYASSTWRCNDQGCWCYSTW